MPYNTLEKRAKHQLQYYHSRPDIRERQSYRYYLNRYAKLTDIDINSVIEMDLTKDEIIERIRDLLN